MVGEERWKGGFNASDDVAMNSSTNNKGFS